MTDENKGVVLYEMAAVTKIPDALNLRAIATDLLNSGLYPNVKNATQAIAVIATGQEIGLGPTASLQYIAPINGRMTMESKVMLALFQRSGGKIKILERSKAAARVEFSKPGNVPYTFEYTDAMAKTELLWDKATWKKMPDTMLFWRCLSNGIKAYDPGVIMGIAMSTEEAEDYPGGIAPEAKPEPGKEAKKGPGRPKAEKPSPEAQKAPEKPAQAQLEAAPAAKPAPPKAESSDFELEDKKTGFEDAETSETAGEEDETITAIKKGLEEQGVELKAFKEWLIGHQDKMKPGVMGGPKRKFLVKLGKSIRFHGGVHEDHVYLLTGLVPAVGMFHYYTRPNQEDEEKG